MLKITCPSNNIPERSYAINVLFDDLLGVNLSIKDICFDDSVQHYHIQCEDKSIVVEDHFFQKHPEPLTYLEKSNIPDSLNFFHAKGLEIPIIYGIDKYIKNKNTITIGLDIFASTFFMLSRWEESLLGREEKGDCDETQLFAVRKGIHQRPIVHEYETLLKTLLSELGFQFKEREYQMVMSHDVDGFLTPSYIDIAKSIIHQFRYGTPKNRSLNLTWKEKIKYKTAFPSAFSQFELYTSLCKRYDIAEWFFLKVCEKGELECTYNYNDRHTIEIIKWLKEQKKPMMVLGFHPSQSTFSNERQWDKEKNRICGLLGYTPKIGRNHHLLYNYDKLRMEERMAEESSMECMETSNCGFHKLIGFRSGMAVPYYVFDIYQRRTMKVREHPFQIMDTAIRYRRKEHTERAIWDDICSIVESAKQSKCELILTWHIYIRNKKLIKENFKWCENTVDYAANK